MTEPADVPKTGDLSQSEEPADSAPPSADTIAAETPAEEPAEPMDNAPHVHAPHGGIHNWRDFFVHIAVVAIGLLLAIGLEQSVEAAHHAHQRAQLEEQMRDTFVANMQVSSNNRRVLSSFRAYLVELQAAVAARRHGQSTPIAPAATDPRSFTRVDRLNLGPYEASKADGSVALLRSDRIRIYDRVAGQQGLLNEDTDDYRHSVSALRAFRKRFDTSPTNDGLSFRAPPAELTALSSAELVEYQALVGTAIEAIDQLVVRLGRVDAMSQAILDGAREESELIAASR